MRNRWLTLSLVFVLSATPALADDLAKFQEDSRKVVKEMASTLGNALQKEMTANGPAADYLISI